MKRPEPHRHQPERARAWIQPWRKAPGLNIAVLIATAATVAGLTVLLAG